MGKSVSGSGAAQNARETVKVSIPSISGEFRIHQTTEDDGTKVNHRSLLLPAKGLPEDILYFPIVKLVKLGSKANPDFGLYFHAKLEEFNTENRKRIAIRAIAKNMSYEGTYVKHEAGEQFGETVFTKEGFHVETEKVSFNKALTEAIEKVCNISLD